MATIQQVINRSEFMQTIRSPVLYRWLGEFDGVQYRYPEDKNTELKIKEPNDNLYVLYVRAMNDFFNFDLAAYSASAVLFEHEYSEYLRKNGGVQG